MIWCDVKKCSPYSLQSTPKFGILPLLHQICLLKHIYFYVLIYFKSLKTLEETIKYYCQKFYEHINYQIKICWNMMSHL